ncbi:MULTISPECIES: response regulator transcription factor [unclassified Rathayibacter]|uniref:response regulator transcription factor n=1 Tax=unclassified Rathayibacter TaxID=2609250 RepID=UPI00188BAF61|nr:MULTISPECIES: response regulator transcription factor [unclassified Rathayibacter]MBF4463288.1 response regulator transcription factor [Rathayibacter sp. VKM Ac-2879]MBF4504475.1 response regulator transcription factor [Rathayibacter sp. VKM Ac-2878]
MRIIVADDSALLRDGISSLLESADHEVVTAVDATDLRQRVLAAGDELDLVITDVRMPPGNRSDGVDAALDLRRQRPGLPVLLLSNFIATAYLSDLFAEDSRALGYLLKDRVGRVDDFLRSIELIANGGTVIDPEILSSVSGKQAPASSIDVLSARESEVLALMAQARSNPEIGSLLHLSDSAVSKHIGSIFAKLGLAESDPGHRRVRAVLLYLDSVRQRSDEPRAFGGRTA